MTVLVRDGSCLPPLQDPVVVSIGNFDGLHRGHQSVLQKLQSVGEPESSRVLMSFYPHPSVVLGYAKEMPRISSWRSMLELLEGYGISVFYLKHFTRAFSKVGAVDFCRELLVNELRAAHVVVGEDAAVGKGREGTPERLKEILAPENCQLHVVDFIKNIQDEKISSGTLRKNISEGDIERANRGLGRCYSVEGKVISGDRRGKGLGYPTANLVVRDQVVPHYGIYATRVMLGDRCYNAATNVGISPTFSGQEARIESYLLDYEGPDFYGQRISVMFEQYLRPEQKFESIEALVKQIELDVAGIREILGC